MSITRQDLEQLIRNPRESLDTELKRWFDPTLPEGAAKIAVGCMALAKQQWRLLHRRNCDDGKQDSNANGCACQIPFRKEDLGNHRAFCLRAIRCHS